MSDFVSLEILMRIIPPKQRFYLRTENTEYMNPGYQLIKQFEQHIIVSIESKANSLYITIAKPA